MRVLIYVSLLTIFTGCEFFQEKTDLVFKEKVGIRNIKGEEIDFTDIKNKILTPHCIKCHGDYSSYAIVYSQRNSILRSIKTNRMPKNKPALSDELKFTLEEWIKAGAPERRGVTPNPGKVTVGLSEKMKELYEIHKNIIPGLDDDHKVALSKEGRTFEYSIEGGKEVQLQYGLSKIIKGVTRLDIIDDTCGKVKAQACLYAAHMFSNKQALVWTKHPDPSKIGEIAEVNTSSGDDEPPMYEVAEDISLEGAQSAVISPTIDKKIKDYIVCEDWSWAKQEKVKILSWNVERMETNMETEVNENRVFTGMYDLSLDKYDQYVYQLSQPKYIEARIGRFSIVSIFGEAGSFYYEDGVNQCQVSFKFDFNSLVSDIVRQNEDVNKTIILKPYHKGQDNTFFEKGDEEINSHINEFKDGDVR